VVSLGVVPLYTARQLKEDEMTVQRNADHYVGLPF